MFRRLFLYGPDDGLQGGGGAGGTPSTPTSPTAGPLNPDVFNEQGQRWRDLYQGTRGSVEQVKAQHASALAEVQAQIDAHLTTLRERDEQIVALNAAQQDMQASVTTLAEQAKVIPTLTQRAAYADKLEIFLRFPELVSVQIEQEMPGDEGQEPRKVMVNPYLEMLSTTSLTGDALAKHLAQLTLALPKQSQRAPNTPPAPPTPITQDSAPASILAEVQNALKKNPNDPDAVKGYFAALDMLAKGRTQQ